MLPSAFLSTYLSIAGRLLAWIDRHGSYKGFRRDDAWRKAVHAIFRLQMDDEALMVGTRERYRVRESNLGGDDTSK